MRGFILSLLAACCAVQGSVLKYPHHKALLAFSPSRGEFPVQQGLAKGFIRYFDNNGQERTVEYNYPEPLYGQRAIGAINPLLKSSFSSSSQDYSSFSGSKLYQQEEVSELIRQRENHFREWCEQRLTALKSEIQLLRSQGLNPSKDILNQIQPLETILKSTISGGFISETPEVENVREEHCGMRLFS